MTSHKCVTETLTLVKDCERVLIEHLESTDGKAEFPALFDLTGNLIAARLVAVNKRSGFSWTVLKDDNPDSAIIEWFNASNAKNHHVARRHDAAHGYYVGSVLANATVSLVGSATHSLHAAIVRADGGFSRHVDIIDNGQRKGLGSHYGRLKLLR